MVVQVLPLSAFTAAVEIDIAAYEAGSDRLSPMASSGWDWRINLDGLVTYSAVAGSASRGYAQTFRNGVAEWALVLRGHEERMVLPSAAYEQDVIRCLTDYLRVCGRIRHRTALLCVPFVRGCTRLPARRSAGDSLAGGAG